MKQRIIAVHLLNDYSGSPMVFKQALQILQQSGYFIHLYTSTAATGGCLSHLPAATSYELPYTRYNNRLLTLFSYLFVQAFLFFVLLFRLQKKDIVYINTLLPAGAALAGWCRGCKVVYHIHEVSISPVGFKNLLSAVVEFTAHRVIFVSQYVRRSYSFSGPFTSVVYNALPHDFTLQAGQNNATNLSYPFTVLMLCSLKAYKGIYEFVACARLMPNLRFVLVLNAGAAEVETFKKSADVPANCHLHAVQTNTHAFYKQAHVVVNLSRTNEWIETFGLTILEGMAYGRPVIVPSVGGVCELVEPGVNGYRINSAEMAQLVNALQELSGNIKLYLSMSEKSRLLSERFSISSFGQELTDVFCSLDNRDYGLLPVE